MSADFFRMVFLSEESLVKNVITALQ